MAKRPQDRHRRWRRGVLIAVKDLMLSTDISELQTDCEIVWAKVNIVGTKSLLLCSNYHQRDEHSLLQFQESIIRATSINDSIILIAVDFKLPGWDRKSKILKAGTAHARLHYQFSDCLDDNGLIQIVENTRRNNNTLDLVITNLSSNVQQVTTQMPGISDHYIVFVELDLSPNIHIKTPRKTPLYKKAR